MDQLTNFYKNKAEQLAEQIAILENKLQTLTEDQAPGNLLLKGAETIQGRSRRTGTPTEPTLLRRDPNVPSVAGVDDYNPGPPSAIASSPENNPPPYLIARDPNVPTPPSKGSPAPVAGGSSTKQDDVMKGLLFNMNRIQSAWSKKGTPNQTAGTPANSSSDGYDISAAIGQSPDKIDSMNDPSKGGQSGVFGFPQKAQDSLKQAITNITSGTVSQNTQQTSPQPASTSSQGTQTNSTSSYSSQTATNNNAQVAGHWNDGSGKPVVQKTSDPNVSTYQAGAYLEKDKIKPGRIQLIHSPESLMMQGEAGQRQRAAEMGRGANEWAKRQLEAELGISQPGKAGQKLRAEKNARLQAYGTEDTGYGRGSVENTIIRLFGKGGAFNFWD